MLKYNNQNLLRMPKIVVIFGSVPVGTTVYSKVLLKNYYLHDVNYTFEYPCKRVNLYEVFRVMFPKHVTLKAEKSIEFCVYFSPLVANQDYIDYFTIKDKRLNIAVHLTIQGSSAGPRISLLPEKILYLSNKTTCGLKKPVKLQNNSITMANFRWLLNPTGHGPFKIANNLSGVLEPFKSVICYVGFNENFDGSFEEDLVCLIHQQEPLILNVRGTRSSLGIDDRKEENISESFVKSQCNFSTVMEDMVNIRNDLPIVSISSSYLDFGLGNATDDTWNIAQPLTISNHLDEEGHIHWYQEPEEIFMIEPNDCAIEKQGVKDFIVKFRPRESEKLYSTILFGYFASIKDKKHTFRIPVIGHTSTLWETNLVKPKGTINENIFFPPTVPFLTVFTNFLLKNNGDSSIIYKFSPPDISSMIVMPMCGLIEGSDNAIILAALHPTCSGFYLENWKVVIDNSTEIEFKFYGCVDNIEYSVTIQKQFDMIKCNNFLSMETTIYPSLYEDGNNNDFYENTDLKENDIFKYSSKTKEIVFDTTYPGSEAKCVLLFHNITRNYLHVRVLGNADWLNVDGNSSIILRPNEVNPLCLIFKPFNPGYHNSVITFSAAALYKMKPIGVPLDSVFNVTGYCSVTKIRVLPRSAELGRCLCGQNFETKFSLINVGESPLHFKLYDVQRNINNEILEGNNLLIKPNKGTLQPRNYCNIIISFSPNVCIDVYIKIFCVIRQHMSSSTLTPIEPNNIKIFHFHYEGIHPTLQVYSIRSIQCEKMYSELTLWRMLNIDEFNKAIISTFFHKTARVELTIPAKQVNSSPIQLGLLLKGKDPSFCQFSLNRHKLCNCPLLRQSRKMTFVEHVYKCPHRSILQLIPLNGEVNNKTTLILQIKVNYMLTGEHTLAYDLSLPPNRTVTLYFNIKITEEISTWLWPLYHEDEWDELKEHEKSIFYLDLGKIFIGNHDPVFRWFLLENTMAGEVKWQMLRANTSSSATIRCLTGMCKAQPDTQIRIMFSFKPIDSIQYEENFMGILNYRKVVIIARGEGTTSTSMNPRIDIPLVIINQKRYIPSTNIVNLSREHIVINDLPTKMKVTRMFAISNPTTQVIQFRWNKLELSGSVICYVTPEEDIIQPNKKKWLLLNICAQNLPTYFTTQIRCDLFDLSERRILKKHQLIIHSKSSTDLNTDETEINRKLEKKNVYLTLTVNTVSPRDGNIFKARSDIYLKSSCQKGPTCGKEILQMKYCRFIIEDIIWTVLRSETIAGKFRKMDKSEIPTYLQFVKAPREKNLQPLNTRNLSDIFEELLYDSIVKYADSGSNHLIHNHENK